MTKEWMYPVFRPKVSSPFGPRIINGAMQNHMGVDFITEDGNKIIMAIADGEVIHDQDYYNPELRWDITSPYSGGRFVIIKHDYKGATFFVRYLHLEENMVSVGQKVKAGQQIGIMGDLGYSFGVHLHLDVYDQYWVIQNPEPFFKGER